MSVTTRILTTQVSCWSGSARCGRTEPNGWRAGQLKGRHRRPNPDHHPAPQVCDGTPAVVTVSHGDRDPDIVVAIPCEPGPESGFYPGVHIIPETKILLVGAGTRLVAYDLETPRRLWEEEAGVGFWGWQRHGDTILMSAEIELAAWNLNAEKLWTTFVEPPWDYEVRGGEVHLDVMGQESRFDLIAGPEL